MRYQFVLREDGRRIMELKTDSLKGILKTIQRKFDQELIRK